MNRYQVFEKGVPVAVVEANDLAEAVVKAEALKPQDPPLPVQDQAVTKDGAVVKPL